MDIYFTSAWGDVNRFIEKGKPQIFTYESEDGKITNQYIIREIPILIDGKQYYDIASPYGYGGPHIESCTNKERLLADYEHDFGKYCADNDIISEFVRFHPIANNAVDFREVYNAEFSRKTVGTSLESDNPFETEFSKSARKYVRRALKAGVEWKVVKAPENVDSFIEIYYSTMERDKATDFYYFPKEYFNRCLELFGNDIILVEAIYEDKIIAAGFYICSGDTIHAHLSGTLKEYIDMSPAYVIKYATALWGKENGYKLVHYGGGTTNSPEDKLFLFKCKFTRDTLFDFYIGKKIWNSEIYSRLVEITGKENAEYFPQYRA